MPPAPTRPTSWSSSQGVHREFRCPQRAAEGPAFSGSWSRVTSSYFAPP